MPYRRILAAMLVFLGLALTAEGASAQAASVEAITVHSPSVEGNLEGNSADREVIVILPPSYVSEPERRYPTIYFLHGFTSTAAKYDERMKFSEALAAEAARGNEFILVVPDSYTRHGGAMYSNSPTTGNFEGFIARDLVAYIDRHYRTIAERPSRGLAGHSMGGYGTLRIGMKYPEVFSSLYAMSSCCLATTGVEPERVKELEGLTVEEAVNGDFGTRAMFASASAWSPAPDKPPFYLEWPAKDGAADPRVLAQWHANSPNAMVPQYTDALKSMSAIALDIGDKDSLLPGNREMVRLLERFGIAHSFTVYDGDHGNRVPQRFREFVLPFFAQHLARE